MVLYTGGQKRLTGALNTKSLGLKQSGTPGFTGSRAIGNIKKRTRPVKRFTTPIQHGRLWRKSAWHTIKEVPSFCYDMIEFIVMNMIHSSRFLSTPDRDGYDYALVIDRDTKITIDSNEINLSVAIDGDAGAAGVTVDDKIQVRSNKGDTIVVIDKNIFTDWSAVNANIDKSALFKLKLLEDLTSGSGMTVHLLWGALMREHLRQRLLERQMEFAWPMRLKF